MNALLQRNIVRIICFFNQRKGYAERRDKSRCATREFDLETKPELVCASCGE
jgi:hypothetical protein